MAVSSYSQSVFLYILLILFAAMPSHPTSIYIMKPLTIFLNFSELLSPTITNILSLNSPVYLKSCSYFSLLPSLHLHGFNFTA